MTNEKNNPLFDDTDLWQGLDEVKGWEKLPWFEAGHSYLLEVLDVKTVNSSQEYGVRYYVITFEIIESTCATLPAGSRAAHVIKVTRDAKTRIYGPMNFKQFLSGVTDTPLDEKGVFDELGKAAIKDGALNGEKVRLTTMLNRTGKFTNHLYSPYKE